MVMTTSPFLRPHLCAAPDSPEARSCGHCMDAQQVADEATRLATDVQLLATDAQKVADSASSILVACQRIRDLSTQIRAIDDKLVENMVKL